MGSPTHDAAPDVEVTTGDDATVNVTPDAAEEPATDDSPATDSTTEAPAPSESSTADSE